MSSGEVATPATDPIEPAGRVPEAARPRVVYCITSHTNPTQVLRLVRTIRAGSPESFILVHHDFGASNLDTAAVRAAGNCHVIASTTRVEWGRFNQLYPTMRSLEWAVGHRAFDWFVLLSGQDYPVQPLARVERFLGDTRYDGFVESTDVRAATWHVGPSRYLYHYYDLPRFRGWSRLRAVIERHARQTRDRGRLPYVLTARGSGGGLFRVGIRPLRSPFRGDFRCYVGSAWWTINRRCADYLVADWRRQDGLRRYYPRTLFAATESYPQTVLRNNRELTLFNNDLRHITWHDHRASGHPDVLRARDFDVITSSGDHFARKFDARVDDHVLDMLDDHIGTNAAAARR